LSEKALDLDRYIHEAASLLDIDVDASWLEPIRFHLEISLRAARLVDGFALPDDAEPAPVFVA
jgi:hypothetical protein